MEENPSQGTPSGSDPSGGQLHGPRGWLAERGRTSENGSALAFGVRLVAAGALTLGLVGAVTYVVLDRNLASDSALVHHKDPIAHRQDLRQI